MNWVAHVARMLNIYDKMIFAYICGGGARILQWFLRA
jgi:hypothetical protein